MKQARGKRKGSDVPKKGGRQGQRDGRKFAAKARENTRREHRRKERLITEKKRGGKGAAFLPQIGLKQLEQKESLGISPLERHMIEGLERVGRPVLLGELTRIAGVVDKKPEILQTAARLEEKGLMMEHRGKYQLSAWEGLVAGQVVKVNQTFGFVTPLGLNQDMFIPGGAMLGALPGDKVLVRETRGKGGELTSGEIVKILQKGDWEFSGVIVLSEQGEIQVLPDREVRFPFGIDAADLLDARPGEKVLCKIARRGQRHFDHRARVLQVFGSARSAASCCDAVLAVNGIVPEFSEEELEEAKRVEQLGIHPKEAASRLDLRAEPIFTIDSADSKDLDDAVSVKKTEAGWEVGVHIADVSHYLPHKGVLDRCAFERGTSIYYAASVIPMLPRELSNGICSLNPGEDRLAFSALLTLNNQGDIVAKRFEKTVIRSRVKGVYKEINQILDGAAPDDVLKKYEGLLEEIRLLNQLTELLIARHQQRGGLSLETSEAKILLDSQGRAVDVQLRSRGRSECIIEELMLLANQAAATLAEEKGLPFVYRIHEPPSNEKVDALKEVLERLGLPCDFSKGVTPKALGALLDQVRGRELEPVVNNLVLRSMAKARYSEENQGHYGLVLQNYAHFTSPIRRYPDLAIHRILSGLVTGMGREKIDRRYTDFVREASAHSSAMELKAMTVERQCEDCYKAEYMSAHLGEQFDGVISGATNRGIYVELANGVEGMIRMEHLPQGEYEYDGAIQLTEKISGRYYRVGTPLRIQVAAADVSAGLIDFILPEEQSSGAEN